MSSSLDTDDRATPSILDDAWQQHLSGDRSLLVRLIGRHREKHRRYHTMTHLEAVINAVIELDAVDPVDDLGAVVAGAFYHDAVYEPASPANERASARLARRDLSILGWEERRADRVGRMIEATSRHQNPPDREHALLFDADLMVLGAAPDDYAAYVDAVRAEYRHVDDDAWRTGRRGVLQAFLERDAIYATPTGRRRWEHSARTNLAEELETLSD